MNIIQDLKLKPGVRVLLRVDLNVPLNDNLLPTDHFRIDSALPTIKLLLDGGAKVFLLSHLGKPKGQPDDKFSLSPVVPILSEKLGEHVELLSYPYSGDELKLKVQENPGCDVFLLENLRFDPGEEANSLDFAKEVASLAGAEAFVQDAFGVIHREHASLVQLPKLLPSYAGLLLQKELLNLTPPASSDGLGIIVGGAKVESKLPVILNFQDKAQHILTGGMVANTLLKFSGSDISASLFSEESKPEAEQVLQNNTQLGNLSLPTDVLVGTSVDDLIAEQFHLPELKPDRMILDLGHLTVLDYQKKLSELSLVIWAGTLGYAENPAFAYSSKQILKTLLDLKTQKGDDFRIVIGGGDTVDFVNAQLANDELSLIDHISTGGSASLLALSGQELPGVTALEQSSLGAQGDENSSPEVLQIPESSNNQSELKSESKPEFAKPVLVANLKANFSKSEAQEWLSQVLQNDWRGVDLKIAAPDTLLDLFTKEVLDKSLSVQILAQDVSASSEGAHTGEIAPSMLDGLATGVLVGHSERRQELLESNDLIAQKMNLSLESSLDVILCVGSLSDDINVQKQEVYEQLDSALSGASNHKAPLVKIAFEPTFAIGKSQPPGPEFLKEMLSYIHQSLERLGFERVPVLYGGSVKESNAKLILALGFNGLLIGSASLDPAQLVAIGKTVVA